MTLRGRLWCVVLALLLPSVALCVGLATAGAISATTSVLAVAVWALFALALGAWAVLRIGQPIALLAQAARQLERDEVPDVPPTGLAEADVVAAALRRAGMQAELDLTERGQAIEELRRNEEAQRLLVRLHDAIGGLSDPAQVQWEIVTHVGRHFKVSRCVYGEVDIAQQHLRIERDHVDGVASLAGRHRLDDFGATLLDELKAGRTLNVADLQRDLGSASGPQRATFVLLEARALLCVPLRREGRLVALLWLQHRQPRPFSADDVALLEQVTERTWFAVDRARAEAALRESRDVLSLAMRSGRMGAWSRDMASERVWWSRELEEIFGVPPGAFGGTTQAFRALVHPDDEPRLAAAIRHAIAERTDYAVEFRFRHASGEWRWMEGRGRAIHGEDARPAMLYGLGIDISARKHTEDELRRLNAELSQAHRRKDEFLATLAHELRNPLAPISNALEILRLKVPADPEMRWTRDVIERQVRQMTRLVDDLLDVARITRGKIVLRRERIALSSVVHGAIEAARPLIEASGHELQLSLPTETIWLDADPTRLTQVLLNLLNNAAKYTPRGGCVALRASRQGGKVAIEVRDNGIGISGEHLPSVFEMFSQVEPALDRSQGGLGIGLALARGLVELHGGAIRAHSDGPGQGSVFHLHLPWADGASGTEPPSRSGTEPPSRSGTAAPAAPRLRVLVVDDNRDAAESLAMMLELSGHELAIVHDGEAALQTAPRFDPDVVLLDIGMPGMNGYQVAERLRCAPAGQRTLLVALTGWGQEEDKRRALAAGFDHHLTKPVDPASLLAVLHAGELRRLAADQQLTVRARP